MTEGPLIETQRVTVPGTCAYVEIRQERHAHAITYVIEHGDVRWGHRGTWGRSCAVEAASCFSSAVAYLVR